jgi:selenide, water dikinase
LSDVLQFLQTSTDPNLLVGFESGDDAAVYRLQEDLALISTVDFITPPVDDPYWFGQIAAANSLSDIYAMAGQPLVALNLVMFPTKKLDIHLLRDILRGGADKIAEAGACMAGGHSVDDNEPKYGLCVTGRVHPERVLTNGGVKDQDRLILTKPIGTGVLFNANRDGKLAWPKLEQILPQVAALNKKAIEIALTYDIHACTDVTGFGIVGHMLEMARASDMEIHIRFDSLPFYPYALDMYARGQTTGSNKANRKLAHGFLRIEKELSRAKEEILFDPQTSGGLLLSVPASQADELVQKLRQAGINTADIIGQAHASRKPFIIIN